VGQTSTDVAWTTADLLRNLQQRTKLFVLDVRNQAEFERFPLEGPAITVINSPYSAMIEGSGREPVDSVTAFIERNLGAQLPKDSPVLTVCVKGKTSEIVRQGLLRLGYNAGTLKGGMTAWADYYDTKAIVESAEFSVFQISRPARGCLSYMITAGGRALVVDALRHLHPYLDLAQARSWTISAVLDTHGHADHISGGRALADETGASYHLHPYDAIHPVDMLPATFAYEVLSDGQVLNLGLHELRVLHTPGHTLGMVALVLDDKYLFTGDSIFIQSIARPDLGGKAEAWATLHTRSLRKLISLPEQMIVLPGHFSTIEEADFSGRVQGTLATLKQQNKSLLVLQRESDEDFVRYLLGSLPKFLPEYVEIKRVNTGLASPSEAGAATLELGKNVCGLAQAASPADSR
jgi:glyoxylase-like metal-dependent hydrolase (beta-lactamase superfamily II)